MLGEQINTLIDAVYEYLYLLTADGVLDSLHISGQVKGYLITYKGLIAMVGEKNPILCGTCAGIEQIFFFVELELIGFLLHFPRGVTASAELSRHAVKADITITVHYGDCYGLIDIF